MSSHPLSSTPLLDGGSLCSQATSSPWEPIRNADSLAQLGLLSHQPALTLIPVQVQILRTTGLERTPPAPPSSILSSSLPRLPSLPLESSCTSSLPQPDLRVTTGCQSSPRNVPAVTPSLSPAPHPPVPAVSPRASQTEPRRRGSAWIRVWLQSPEPCTRAPASSSRAWAGPPAPRLCLQCS